MNLKMLATSGPAQCARTGHRERLHRSARRWLVHVRTIVWLTLVACPASLAGQSAAPPLREQVFLSAGGGVASFSATCDRCSTYFFAERSLGPSWHLMAGGSATDRLVIGGEISGWTGDAPPVSRRALSLNIVFRGYFRRDGRLFVKGGAGAIRVIAQDQDDDTKTDAWLFHTGVGYDFPAGRHALTAYATYQWSPSGTTWLNGFLSPTPILPNVVQVGLAYTLF